MKNVFVIVRYDFVYGGYLTFAYNGLFFASEEDGNDYIELHSLDSSYSVEMLSAYNRYKDATIYNIDKELK